MNETVTVLNLVLKEIKLSYKRSSPGINANSNELKKSNLESWTNPLENCCPMKRYKNLKNTFCSYLKSPSNKGSKFLDMSLLKLASWAESAVANFSQDIWELYWFITLAMLLKTPIFWIENTLDILKCSNDPFNTNARRMVL